MPSESKLRSIYREVLQDQIIIKSIFSTTVRVTEWAPLSATVNAVFIPSAAVASRGKYKQ